MTQHLETRHRLHPHWGRLPQDASHGLVARGVPPPPVVRAGRGAAPLLLVVLPMAVAIGGLALALVPLA